MLGRYTSDFGGKCPVKKLLGHLGGISRSWPNIRTKRWTQYVLLDSKSTALHGKISYYCIFYTITSSLIKLFNLGMSKLIMGHNIQFSSQCCKSIIQVFINNSLTSFFKFLAYIFIISFNRFPNYKIIGKLKISVIIKIKNTK